MARKKKAKRSRKKKTAKPKTEKPAAQEPAYSHPSKLRCTRCDTIMRADGTTQGGRVKCWQCPNPVCGRRQQTVGKEI